MAEELGLEDFGNPQEHKVERFRGQRARMQDQRSYEEEKYL